MKLLFSNLAAILAFLAVGTANSAMFDSFTKNAESTTDASIVTKATSLRTSNNYIGAKEAKAAKENALTDEISAKIHESKILSKERQNRQLREGDEGENSYKATSKYPTREAKQAAKMGKEGESQQSERREEQQADKPPERGRKDQTGRVRTKNGTNYCLLSMLTSSDLLFTSPSQNISSQPKQKSSQLILEPRRFYSS